MQAPIPSTKRTGGPIGVCAAIGADFGFNPDILRVALAAGLLWNLPAILALYGVAALLMLAGRALFPVVAASPVPAAAIVPASTGDRPVFVEQERLAA
jgi:phage shock protein C